MVAGNAAAGTLAAKRFVFNSSVFTSVLDDQEKIADLEDQSKHMQRLMSQKQLSQWQMKIANSPEAHINTPNNTVGGCFIS